MANFTAGTSFSDGVTNDVTALKLNALVADAVPTSNLSLTSTTGTIANFTASTANITLGTIPTLTAGTTTGTAGVFTSGTIATLNSTTPTFLGAITASTNTINVGSGQIFKDATGNVGVGTASPSSKLHVASGDILISDNFGIGAGGGAQVIYNGTSQFVRFDTASTERLRIDSSGNLLVGTTSNFSADKMCLNFTSAQNGLGVRDDSNSSGANYAVFRNSTNGVIGTISRVTTTDAVVYNTASDQRLKSNIADASPVLDKLMDVKVRQFDWTDGNLHQDAGFIAQELAPILSGIVTEGKTQEDWWQLDYARLTPYLVKAIQELKVKNDSLEARLQALEAK